MGFQSVPFFSGDVLTGVDLGIAASVGGTLQFAAASYSVNESAGVVTITVTRTDNLLGAIAVQYTTTPATAVHGSDFSPQIGLLNFATGQSSAGFTVPIVNDTINEGSETFTVSLFTPLGARYLVRPARPP